MPYCDQCGNKVSITDKRCSKCGNKLDSLPTPDDVSNGIEGIFTKIKRFFSTEPYRNIEFILALIGFVFILFSLPEAMSIYGFASSDFFKYLIIALIADFIGVIVIRYYAKIGAVIILIASFSIFILGVMDIGFAFVFIIIAAILAFVR